MLGCSLLFHRVLGFAPDDRVLVGQCGFSECRQFERGHDNERRWRTAGGSMAHASGGAAGAATDGVSGNGGTPVGGASGSSGSGGSNVGCKTAGSSGPLFTRLPCLLSETGSMPQTW